MRRSRSEDGDELDGEASVVVAASSGGGGPHRVLTRPVFLSRIFKFVVRKRKHIKLIYVHSAWEDTAVNYSPWLWSGLLRAKGVQKPPPPQGTPTVEQVSQHLFNYYVRWVLAPTLKYRPSIFDRLVAPRVVDLSYLDRISDSALVHLGKHATITELNLGMCEQITDAGLERISRLKQLQTLNIESCEQISDYGLWDLAGLQQLQSLNIGGCKQITDAGLQHLADLPLKHLSASECYKITAGARAQFKQAHPHCATYFSNW